ncbi:flagellar hook-length control protein FliK [Sulfurimonas sp. SAG-AH-194-I05]|nr:flagellar hook-length control protein FliK [Sulfurimonas sp. SAG-AH-194-I05]MDF1874514.1 flagellar hook-length control protein FliK [Sulfurimonas sp. SAG-AH-194-I05]
MINITSTSNLGIFLPSNNKALAQVLSSATIKELEILTQGKDLKSIMGNILKQSGSSDSKDKMLLDLIKKNPTLSNLGEPTKTIKDLLHSIKKVQQTTQSLNLQKAIPTEEKPDNKSFELTKTLQNKGEADTKLQTLEKVLKTLTTDIKEIKNNNGLDLKQKFKNSGVILESKLADVKNPQNELKSTLIVLANKLQKSPLAQSKNIVNEAKSLLNTEILKSATPQDTVEALKERPKQLQEVANKVETLVLKLKTAIKSADTIHSPTLSRAIEVLEHKIEPRVLTSENFKLTPVKEALEEVSLVMRKSFTVESKGILASLEKIFQSIKTIDATVDAFLKEKLPQEISKLTETIKHVITKDDVLYDKDTKHILNKLQTLQTAQKIHPHNNVKEILTNDLKAVLMKTSEELQKNPHVNQNEVLKNIEKLSLQIDHYQLVSQLSNGAAMYLPFSWDMMDEGSIHMQKSEDDTFNVAINLKLKEYGELSVTLSLYEKNQVNIHIYSANKELKEIVKQNIASLRSGLIDAQITPREIRISEPKSKLQHLHYQANDDTLDMGFEVKA